MTWLSFKHVTFLFRLNNWNYCQNINFSRAEEIKEVTILPYSHRNLVLKKHCLTKVINLPHLTCLPHYFVFFYKYYFSFNLFYDIYFVLFSLLVHYACVCLYYKCVLRNSYAIFAMFLFFSCFFFTLILLLLFSANYNKNIIFNRKEVT